MQLSIPEKQLQSLEDAIAAMLAKIEEVNDLRGRLRGSDWKMLSEYLTIDLPDLRKKLIDFKGKKHDLGRLQGELAVTEMIADLDRRLAQKVQLLTDQLRAKQSELQNHKQRMTR